MDGLRLQRFTVQKSDGCGWEKVTDVWAKEISLVHQTVDDYAKANAGTSFRAVNSKDETVVPIIRYGFVQRRAFSALRH